MKKKFDIFAGLLRFASVAGLLFGSAFCAEAERLDSIRWKAELSADFSHGDFNPFWFSANRQGLSSVTPNNGYVSLGAFKDMKESERFSWGAGVELAGAWNFTSPFVVQQLYGEVKYRCLDLLVGSKNMEGPISDPYLSTGNLVHSGNARPIPQVRAGIFDYADVWGLNGWIGVKGYLAYGAFTDGSWQQHWEEPAGRYNKGTLYCGRGLWIRNGNENKFPLVFEAGIEMVTEFGGSCYNLGYPGSGITVHMPKNFKAFVKALIPHGGDQTTIASEQQNVQGNMLGAWNFRLSWTPQGKEWGVRAYYQHLFEDHSMLYIDYPWKDGLYGVEGILPRNPWVSKIVYEFMSLKDQSGSVNWTVTPEVPGHAAGADDYYNHNLYVGWEHWGMGIGTPMCLSPIYNRPHNLAFHSNRIRTHHVGLSGDPLPSVSWRLLLTYTRSWGGYNHIFPKVMDVFNGLAEVSYKPQGGKLKGWAGTVGIGWDGGNLIGRNVGVELKISRSGFFGF